MVSGLILAVASLVQQADVDVSALHERARRAEARYERAARRLAPVTGWSSGSGECDEIVGRFCLRFDDGPPSAPPEEPPGVTDARRAAIDSLRRIVSDAPAELSISGPLVRLLVEDGRPSEAVAAALTFEASTTDRVWGALLAGFALHQAGEGGEAAGRFDRAFTAMTPEERRRAAALDWLLDGAERRRYRELEEGARERYERLVWRLADPLFATAANERRTEHFARYTYARLLERTPVVRDMHRWGRDLEELTIRYGVAYRLGRELGNQPGQSSIVEYYDPDQLAYVPADLLRNGVPPPPPPGAEWPLAAERARSGHAPRNIRSMAPLSHQLSRIPVSGGWVIRVDGRFGLDSLARTPPEPLPGDTARPPAPAPHAVHAGVWLLDEAGAGDFVAGDTTTVPLAGDSATFALELTVPEGDYVYSAEAYEPATRTARRARYAVEAASPESLRASDVIVAEPFLGAVPAARSDSLLRPLSELTLEPGQVIGAYAEIPGIRPGAYGVDVSIRRADQGSLPGRLVRWLGRSLGIARPTPPPRVVWQGEHTGDGPLIIAVDLPMIDLPAGLHVIEIAVTEARSDRRAIGRRLVRIGESN